VLLALDTATRTLGLALHDGQQVLAESLWVGGGRHTGELASEVAWTLRRTGVPAAALTALAVTRGPGSYNGLRVGLALAKGLALALRIPLLGFPTLAVLVRAQPRRSGRLLAVLEAGRGRVAALWYKSARTGWQPQGDPEALTWDEMLARLEKPTYICGEIAAEVRGRLAGESGAELAPPALCLRRPSLLAEMAWEGLRNGAVGDPGALNPVYLTERREPAA
jgi:tRNA threonylcarbamoyladenosine biosynthesis protein TsaB